MNSDETNASLAQYTHLGAYFRDLREHYELDIAQVASRLHIRPKYLEAIESGNMELLPGKVYAQGYISSYAEFLGLDAATVMRHYDGLSHAPTQPEFRIVSPSKQAGVPAWRLIGVGAIIMLLLMLLGRWLLLAPQPDIHSSIEEVPKRIVEKIETPLLVTPRNEACLRVESSPSPLPCYYSHEVTLPKYQSIMELR